MSAYRHRPWRRSAAPPAFGPSCRRCSRARWRAGDTGIDFDGTDWQLPGVDRLPARGARAGRGRVRGSNVRGRTDRAVAGSSSGIARAVARRAAVRGRAGRRRQRRAGRAGRRARRARSLGWRARGRPARARAQRRLRRRRRRRCSSVYADGVALALAAVAIFVPPLSILALVAFVVLLARRSPARGREVRRPADPAVSAPKKLVLAVIDSLKPDMLDLAIEEGRAPALEAIRDRGTYVRDCVSTFPSVTPVASRRDRHRQRPRRAPHPVDELVPPRRGALRRVRLVVRGHARLRRRPLALRHRLQHEHGAPEPCAQDGLRAPRRRRAAHRLHHLADLPGPHPPRPVAARASTAGSPRRPSSAIRSTAPRELFYADLFDSRDTGCTSALGMPGQRDRHTGCVGAYLVENDLFDFLLFSLPDNDTHSHKAGPDGQVTLDRRGRPRARADHARGRRRRRRSSRTTR